MNDVNAQSSSSIAQAGIIKILLGLRFGKTTCRGRA